VIGNRGLVAEGDQEPAKKYAGGISGASVADELLSRTTQPHRPHIEIWVRSGKATLRIFLSIGQHQSFIDARRRLVYPTARSVSSARQLTLCFQRLANLDNGVFERLGRYESAIARQVLRTLYLLQSVRTG
jgi:hypothetical protein